MTRMNISDFFENSSLYGAIGMENMLSAFSTQKRSDVPVTGFHVLSTKPFFAKPENRNKSFKLNDFELKTAELSALCWRKYNGPIFLITDLAGAEYFTEQGLGYAYDGIFPIIENSYRGTDPIKYWAAGKIEALRLSKGPCAIIDLDLIVWRPLSLSRSQLIVAHFEHIHDLVYPPLSYFDMSPRYTFPQEWDEDAKAFNTAFLYIADDSFRKYYAKESIRFMQFERDTVDNKVKCMVFAEQRILGMCAKAKNIKADFLVDYDNLSAHQDNITHVWTAKPILMKHEDLRHRYIELCEKKIKQLNDCKLPD